MSVMPGQATLFRSDEFRFGQVVLGLPGRSSRSVQFRSNQVGPFKSGGSVQVRSCRSDQVTPVRPV